MAEKKISKFEAYFKKSENGSSIDITLEAGEVMIVNFLTVAEFTALLNILETGNTVWDSDRKLFILKRSFST